MKSWIAGLLMLCCVAACTDHSMVGTDVIGLNYTDATIAEFSVDEQGGGGISANGGGGGHVCCIRIPATWKPGMKVTVRWRLDGAPADQEKQAVVEVPPYGPQDIGGFKVHFYPNDVVKVLVSITSVGHPDYPYPRPK